MEHMSYPNDCNGQYKHIIDFIEPIDYEELKEITLAQHFNILMCIRKGDDFYVYTSRECLDTLSCFDFLIEDLVLSLHDFGFNPDLEMNYNLFIYNKSIKRIIIYQCQ